MQLKKQQQTKQIPDQTTFRCTVYGQDEPSLVSTAGRQIVSPHRRTFPLLVIQCAAASVVCKAELKWMLLKRNESNPPLPTHTYPRQDSCTVVHRTNVTTVLLLSETTF